MKKKIIIASVSILVISIIIISLFWINRDRIVSSLLEKTITTFESKIMQKIPAGMDKTIAKEKIDEFKIALKNGKIDYQELKEFKSVLKEAGKDKQLTREEISRLLALFEKISK